MAERSFHIEFEDGSNPYYHFPCDSKTHRQELRKWRKNYTLTLIGKIGDLELYRAQKK